MEVRGGKGWRVKGGREGRGVNRGRGSAMTLSHKLRAVIHGEYSMLVAFKMLNSLNTLEYFVAKINPFR